MVSANINVLRWSALGLGVFYGFYHQRTIKAQDRLAHDKRQFAQKEQLISQAKIEFANKSSPPKAAKQVDEIEALVTGQL